MQHSPLLFLYNLNIDIFASKSAFEYGLKSGLFMLRQPDSFAVEIADFPKGYSAKVW